MARQRKHISESEEGGFFYLLGGVRCTPFFFLSLGGVLVNAFFFFLS
ncbi:hypothetical protein LRY60_05955 [Candidatus Woesebacteria bacterium]|nr:hypothetical protein [Candidatus Woesebacteria bacterium]